MATQERIESMCVEVEELASTLLEGILEEIQAKTQMTHFNTELEALPASATSDASSIYFIPVSTAQRHTFSRLITDELMLRGLDISGTLETRRELLREAMKGESAILRLSKEIAHGKVKEGAYFLLMQTLPCASHGKSQRHKDSHNGVD
jgi:hypothetical protein